MDTFQSWILFGSCSSPPCLRGSPHQPGQGPRMPGVHTRPAFFARDHVRNCKRNIFCGGGMRIRVCHSGHGHAQRHRGETPPRLHCTLCWLLAAARRFQSRAALRMWNSYRYWFFIGEHPKQQAWRGSKAEASGLFPKAQRQRSFELPARSLGAMDCGS